MQSAKKHNQGFSLIEMLVSIALFTVVITIAIGCLLVLISANSRAQNMQRVMTDLSFAIDSISREVRTGRALYCSDSVPDPEADETVTQDCDGGSYLSIIEGGESLTGGLSSQRITFHYDSVNQVVERRVGNGSWYPITSEDVNITELSFYVSDSATNESGDVKQANATVYIDGYVGERPSEETSFSLQTTVSRRILDLF